MSLRTAVAKRPWQIKRGASFDKQLTVKTRTPDGTLALLDLTSSTAVLTVRRIRGAGPVLFALTDGAGITLGDGTLALALTAEETALLHPARYVFDLEVDGSRIVEGQVHVDA